MYFLKRYNFERFAFSLNSKINAINVKVSDSPSLIEKSGYNFKVVDIESKTPVVSDFVKRCLLSSEIDKNLASETSNFVKKSKLVSETNRKLFR